MTPRRGDGLNQVEHYPGSYNGGQASSVTPDKNRVPEDVTGAYMDYYEGLRRFLSRRIGSSEDVDDMVQEVYLRAIQKHNSKFKPSISFLFKIASNLTKMRFREKQRRKEYIHIQIDDLNPASSAGSPEAVLRTKQGAEAINRILGDLKQTQRRLFLMHRIEGLTYEEIAEKLDMKKSQVKNQIYYVLVQIRLSIGKYI